jgi:hypothetical protein
MRHMLTQNGLSYTCLSCHQVLECEDDYDRISCAVEADRGETRRQQDTDALAG